MAKQPEPYKWRTRIRSIASVVLGAITALFPASVASSLDRNLSLTAILIVYVGSAALLSFAWRLYFDQPEELERKIPINSREYRRRKKEFYDWLGSKARR